MPLDSGAKLGHYEILALIGTGGMGEVYRAHDPRLGRDVAIKVSRDQFSERFEREARAVAALNHPNICTLYDVGPNYLVMEFVEGTAPKGPLPLDEALRVARQIADALDAAHEKNITHRDLKPGNIMIRPDGMVKVLDFGLAKVGRTSDSPDATVTLGATQAGAILGTPAYMAPEQAKGKADIDRRADIWAFGVVLYELLVGERAFHGEDLTEVLAAVVLKEPDLSAAPPHLRRLLKKCLEKDPKKRLRDIGDVWELMAPLGQEGGAAATSQAAPTRKLPWIMAAAAIVLAALALWAPWRTERSPQIVRFQLLPPEQSSFTNALSVSPDGLRIAFQVRGPDNQNLVWVRSLETLEARLLAGTEGTTGGLFWSPDSRFIGFASGTRLKRVDASGAPPQTLGDLPATFRGGSWNRDGVIIAGTSRTGMFRVSEAGGTPVPLTTLDASRQETFHGNPTFLPDGRHFLYARVSTGSENSGIYIGSLDAKPEQQDLKRLLESRSGVLFASPGGSADGHLLFLRERALMAQPFDAGRLQLAGEATLVGEDLNVGGAPSFSVSATGILAYRTGAATAATTRLIWFDRQGKQLGQVGPPALYSGVNFTDGKKLLVSQEDPRTGVTHTWTADLPRAVFSRLNPGDLQDGASAMSPDGRIAFTYVPAGAVGDIYVKAASGVGQAELLYKSPTVKHPNHWSPDGRFLIYDDHSPTQRQDLWILPMGPKEPAGSERKPIPFLVTPADETFGQFSPDSKWVAYDSDESGRREVYVQGFAPDRIPATAVGKWTISSAGGNKPRWSHDGKQLFYLGLDGKMMAVPVKATATSFEPGTAVALFDTNVTGFTPYDVAPDGRFLINTVMEAATPNASPITVVLNWRAGLKK